MTAKKNTKKALLIWGNWGPYHYARFRGFKKACIKNGVLPLGLELFQKSNIYEWNTAADEEGITHFSFGDREMDFPLWKCLTQLLPFLWKAKVDYALVPSYWHWSLFINIVCRLRGAKIIMMNESHADTEKASGFKRWIKVKIVKRFHAALVGGIRHKQYFSELGMDKAGLFTGYDAIDVDFFSAKAEKVRQDAINERRRLGLPERYFLSLSRMVEKKNLQRLVEAYAFLEEEKGITVPHIVFVGSGPKEKELRKTVSDFDLPLYDHTNPSAEIKSDNSSKGVHFMGFRQIDENPAFFALAEAFVMPSLWEEWGLVVNEALACSTPVIVSANAGCSEDLVIEGVTGYKIDPRNTASITHALRKISKGVSTSETMGRTGRSLVQKFDCTNFGDNAIRAIHYTEQAG